MHSAICVSGWPLVTPNVGARLYRYFVDLGGHVVVEGGQEVGR